MALKWTPHQYAIDCGWDVTNIQDTAAAGVSAEDANDLTEDQQAELLAWCIEKNTDRLNAL